MQAHCCSGHTNRQVLCVLCSLAASVASWLLSALKSSLPTCSSRRVSAQRAPHSSCAQPQDGAAAVMGLRAHKQKSFPGSGTVLTVRQARRCAVAIPVQGGGGSTCSLGKGPCRLSAKEAPAQRRSVQDPPAGTVRL